jgi:hypothetical protein
LKAALTRGAVTGVSAGTGLGAAGASWDSASTSGSLSAGSFVAA